MAQNVAQKLIATHLGDGEMTPGAEIALTIDQTLTQDATGTLVMLELEAMELDRVKTEVSAQYVDHNLIQEDNKNPDDHLFLQSACERFGVYFSRPGNGISHAVHMERFGRPGRTLLGSDSHTPAAGSMGMLAIGAGGLEVAMAMAGEPFYTKMPKVFGIKLTGKLPDWVSAKDVILEMLRRHGVSGGVGKIIEYYGPGLDNLEAMDRHVIANMGAELGATTTVFPADDEIKRFLKSQGSRGRVRGAAGRRGLRIRRARRDRSVGTRAADRQADVARQRGAGRGDWLATSFIRPISAPRPTRAIAISPSPRRWCAAVRYPRTSPSM